MDTCLCRKFSKLLLKRKTNEKILARKHKTIGDTENRLSVFNQSNYKNL